MKPLDSHNKIALILPHLLITGGLLTIPIVIGYSNSYSLASVLFKFIFPLTILSIFYINYLWLIDKYLFKRKYILFIVLNFLLLSGSFYFQKSHLFNYLRKEHHKLERIHLNNENELYNPKDFNSERRRGNEFRNKKEQNGNLDSRNFQHTKKSAPKFMNRYSFGFLLFQFIAVLTAVGIKFGKRVNLEESRRKDVEAAYLKSKHDLLRYQLQPHFFFNTLNSIHYLIDISKEKAQDTLIDLSQLMRYVLNVTDKEKVDLKIEISFIKNYCELMRLRTADSLDFTLDINQGIHSHEIAPLLIIVLIENAFKHGIIGRDSDYISIKIHEDEQSILVRVKNSRYPKEVVQNDDVSIGLENLKSRLELIYPQQHEIIVNKTITSYETILKLKV